MLKPITEDRKQRTRRAPVTRRTFLANLAITKQVARRDQLIRQTHGLFVIRVIVVAVRKVKRIDVPIRRTIALVNHIKRELIRRRNNGSARLTLREKLLLRYFLRFRVM